MAKMRHFKCRIARSKKHMAELLVRKPGICFWCESLSDAFIWRICFYVATVGLIERIVSITSLMWFWFGRSRLVFFSWALSWALLSSPSCPLQLAEGLVLELPLQLAGDRPLQLAEGLVLDRPL
jgi:hypothetical protein